MKLVKMHPVATLFESILGLTKYDHNTPLIRMFRTEYAKDYDTLRRSGQKITDAVVLSYLAARNV